MNIVYLIPRTVDIANQLTTEIEIAKSMKKLGAKVTTLVAYRNKPLPLPGFDVVDYVHVPAGSISAKLMFHFRMLELMWKSDADVVMAGFPLGHLLPLVRLGWRFRKKRPKLVMDVRSIPVDVSGDLRGKMRLYRYRLGLLSANLFCDGFTAITPMLLDSVKKFLPRLNGRFGIWGSGVNLDMFVKVASIKVVELKEKLDLRDRKIIIYHGELSPNRGLQQAVRAMQELKDKDSRFILLFVGDGKGKKELQRLTEQLNLCDWVLFIDKVSYEEVKNYLNLADMAVVPFPDITWWAVSSPIKIMEYLAIGVPVIATDIAANRLVLEKTGGGGLLIENNDPKIIAKTILELDKNGCRMSDRSLLQATISWDSQAQGLYAFLEGLVGL